VKRLLACALVVSGAIGVGGVARAHSATAAPALQTTCGTNLETWFVPEGNGYAGGAGYVIEFSNIGKSACTVGGYPIVALTQNGTRVGLPSTQNRVMPASPVQLAPKQTAHVVLLITDPGAVCKPHSTDGLTVRVPGSGHAMRFSFVGGACPGRSTLRVDAINPGVGIPFATIH
jgi:hypothetical protein